MLHCSELGFRLASWPSTSRIPPSSRRKRNHDVRHHRPRSKGMSRRGILKGGAAIAGAARRVRRHYRLPHHLGAEHQGHRAAPRRPAGHRDPRHRRAGEQGPRLHRADAGVGKRRPAEPLPVAVQRDRLRRHQPGLHALSDRPQHPAGHPAGEVQVLGQDHPAVHQGRIPGRPQGAAAGHHADDDPVRHRRRRARRSPTARRPNG